jgi:hypothetical protein
MQGMTRVRRAVVFIGGSRDIATSLQRAVTGNVRGLARAGVVVPKAGRRATNRGGISHQKLATPGGPDWQSLQQELGDASGETVLLVIPALLRMGGATARHRAVVAQLNAVAEEVHVVSVVADQLTLINEYYVHHVSTWRTSARLEAMVSKLFHNEVFVHERLLRPWYEEADVRYVAVPYARYAAGNPLQVVLQAAGVSMPDPPGPTPGAVTLGPVGVEANRLLATYLRAVVPDFRPDARPVAGASRAALSRAEKLGWCADEFWGWTPRAVTKVLGRFDASNHRFARTVWGTDWPLAYPVERAGTQLDFLDLEVPVIDAIHDYVVSTAGRLAAELEGDG